MPIDADLESVVTIDIYPLMFHILQYLVDLALIKRATTAIFEGLLDLVVLLHGQLHLSSRDLLLGHLLHILVLLRRMWRVVLLLLVLRLMKGNPLLGGLWRGRLSCTILLRSELLSLRELVLEFLQILVHLAH